MPLVLLVQAEAPAQDEEEEDVDDDDLIAAAPDTPQQQAAGGAFGGARPPSTFASVSLGLSRAVVALQRAFHQAAVRAPPRRSLTRPVRAGQP